MTDENDERKCKCGRWKSPDAQFCFFCDPDKQLQALAARKKAGLTRTGMLDRLMVGYDDLPNDFSMPSLLVKAEAIVRNLWERSDKPTNARVILQALEFQFKLATYSMDIKKAKVLAEATRHLKNKNFDKLLALLEKLEKDENGH